MYVPDGVIPELWHPTGNETSFTLPEMSQPLESVRDDLVFVRGLDMYAGGATHEGGIAKVLTGTGAVSLDVFLGEEVGQSTPFRSVQLGVGANFQNGSGSMSFVGAGQQVSPDDNPLNAFDRLFGNLATPKEKGPNWRQIRDTSVVQSAMEDLTRLQGQLGGVEREKLELHIEAVREIEAQVTGEVTGSCTKVSWNTEGFAVSDQDFYPKTYEKEENFALVGKLQMDLLALALGCGVTKVGSLMWSHPVSPTRIPNIGASSANHDASHYGGSPTGAQGQDYIRHKRWFCEQLVYLIEKLRATPDGSGTLLQNTLIFLVTDINDGDLHDHRDMPFVLAGQAAGQLETGRSLDYRGSNSGENETHAKLLVSIANMMGSNIDSFGYTEMGTGPLPGL